MDEPVVRLRALHVRERAHGPPERLLQPQLRERDLARGLVHLEIGQRPVPDAVRLDAHAGGVEVGEIRPLERPVEDAAAGQMLVVRQRPRAVEIADGDEQHRGVAVLLEHRHGVLEVVAVAVVERDQHGAVRQRHAVDVIREHVVERDRGIAELAELRELLVEQRDRHGDRVLGLVVDLVVHEDAQRAAVPAVRGADAGRRLAERAVDAVLQPLLELVGSHEISLERRRQAPSCVPRTRRRSGASPRTARRGGRAEPLGDLAVGQHRGRARRRAQRCPPDRRAGPGRRRRRGRSTPPARLATTPRPRANASITTAAETLVADGRTRSVASSSAADTPAAAARRSARRCPPAARPPASPPPRRVPSADDEPRVRHDASPRRAPRLTRQRCSCSARARRRTAPSASPGSGRSGRSVKTERSMNVGKTASGSAPRSSLTASPYRAIARGRHRRGERRSGRASRRTETGGAARVCRRAAWSGASRRAPRR